MKIEYMYKNILDLPAGIDASANFMFITPPLPTRIYARGIVFANGVFDVKIYESATVSANGSVINTRNFNIDRNLTSSPYLKLYQSPTVTSYGEEMWSTRTSEYKQPYGVSEWINYVIVAKSNTKYIWNIVKRDNAAKWISVDFWWSEDII